jgi:hypothetical protein
MSIAELIITNPRPMSAQMPLILTKQQLSVPSLQMMG